MTSPDNNSLGLYVGIPFCRSKCTYCNFASGVYPAADHDRYVDRLIADMAAAPIQAASLGAELPRSVDTIYLGGGTPSLLAPELIERLFRAIRDRFVLAPDAEITVECAPAQIQDSTLEALVRAGVNRVSLGVQSFVDKEAAESGRLHNRAATLRDLSRLRAVGIHNLNVDLIAGLACQTMRSWQESLDILLETQVPHASVYMLEVDEDSRLGRELLSGGARYHAGLVPTDEAITWMYETACSQLERAGLAQYEISNFARPGYQSRHNLRYWHRRPYLGLGLDASSMLIALPEAGSEQEKTPEKPWTVRLATTSDLREYLDAPSGNSGKPGTTLHETTWLSPTQQLEEAFFLGLRLNSGISIAALRKEFGSEAVEPSLKIAKELAADGLLTANARNLRLTPRGRLISNDVFERFLGLSSGFVGAGQPCGRRLGDGQTAPEAALVR